MADSVHISIVIPAYNEVEYLQKSIPKIYAAIKAQALSPALFELIVCDNNSNDQTAERAKELGAKVIHEPHQQISRARNTGASIASGEWLLFIDADSWPLPQLIQETLALIDQGSLIGAGSTVQVQDGSLWSKLRIERLNPFMRLFNWSGGAYILCEQKAFEEIGGFSEDLYALEEIEFVFRLKKHGRKTGKKFKVLHHYPLITSGRKDELGLMSLWQLIASTVVAVFHLISFYVLPSKWRLKNRSNWMPFWYKRNG